jgi:hypothetical protein
MFQIHRLVAASTTAADYWKIEGNKAIRVHVKVRRHKFTLTAKTTYPGTDDDKDPWLHQLGDVRTTIVKYMDGKTFTIDDNWLHVDSNQQLPEQWTGETIFEYLPEKKETRHDDVTTMETTDDVMRTTNINVDHWTKEGNTWTRHHMTMRSTLFAPTTTTDAPDPRHLSDERTTTMKMRDGTTSVVNDDWKNPLKGSEATEQTKELQCSLTRHIILKSLLMTMQERHLY